MTREETVKLLMELQCAYPLFYSNKGQKDFYNIAKIWHKHIGKYAVELVSKAVELMVSSETEVPTIALLNKYLHKAEKLLKTNADLTDEQLQERIRRLAR